MANVDIYRGRDPRDVPTYSIREAASYMRLPPTTLREWVSGPARVIQLAGGRPPLLSFWNLVEAYVLAALRRRHQVPLQRVRKALRFLERELDTERPLIEQEFLTDGLDLFVEMDSLPRGPSCAGAQDLRALNARLHSTRQVSAPVDRRGCAARPAVTGWTETDLGVRRHLPGGSLTGSGAAGYPPSHA
jgi:hypothetical protein